MIFCCQKIVTISRCTWNWVVSGDVYLAIAWTVWRDFSKMLMFLGMSEENSGRMVWMVIDFLIAFSSLFPRVLNRERIVISNSFWIWDSGISSTMDCFRRFLIPIEKMRDLSHNSNILVMRAYPFRSSF